MSECNIVTAVVNFAF